MRSMSRALPSRTSRGPPTLVRLAYHFLVAAEWHESLLCPYEKGQACGPGAQGAGPPNGERVGLLPPRLARYSTQGRVCSLTYTGSAACGSGEIREDIQAAFLIS
jgi:hypothetical protein